MEWTVDHDSKFVKILVFTYLATCAGTKHEMFNQQHITEIKIEDNHAGLNT